MTDFCQTVSMSIFSTSLYSVIEEPLALLHFRDARCEFILSPHCATLVRCFFETLLCLGKASELALLSTSATLLRFSLYEAVKNQSYIKLEPKSYEKSVKWIYFCIFAYINIYFGDIVPTTIQTNTNMYAHTSQIKHHHGRV